MRRVAHPPLGADFMIRKLLRSLGVSKILLTVTVLAIIASNVLYLLAGYFFIGYYKTVGFLMACFIPAILAPLGTYMFIRVSYQLDRLEESLRESEDKFRILSELAEEGIVIHDNGTIIDANKASSKMFGYELSEVTGLNIDHFFTPDSFKTIKKHIEGNQY